MRIRGRRIGLRNTGRFIILSILNIIEPRARWIAQLFEEWKEKIEAETSAENAIDEFRTVCIDLGMSTPTLDSSTKRNLIRTILDNDYDPSPANIFELAGPKVFSDEPAHLVDSRIAIALCEMVRRKSNSAEKHPIERAVERAISDFEFNEIGLEEQNLLTGFETCILDQTGQGKTDIFEGEPQRTVRDLAEAFLQEYTVDAFALYLLRDKARVDDLRSTLAHLIREGRLSVGNLTADVINSKLREAESELEDSGLVYTGYFLVSHRLLNSGMDSTKRLFSRFPLMIWVKGTEVRGVSQSGLQFKPAFHIVVTDKDYGSASEFLEEAIRPILPNRESWDPHAMVAAVPFQASDDFASVPSKEEIIASSDSSWWQSTVEENFEVIQGMVGESQGLATSLTVEEVVSEAEVEELLRVIPINVFVPGIRREMKDVILDNYPDLKEYFGIQTIFDWAYVDEDELAEKLTDYDEDDAGSDEEWLDTSEKIIEGAKECYDATSPEPEFGAQG